MPAYCTAVATALLLVTPLACEAAETVVPTQIVVSGTGTVSLPPDRAVVSGTVETYDGHSASVAVSDNAAIYDRLVAALVAAGVARSAVALSWYQVRYTAPPDERSGYTVSRSFTVSIQQPTIAGAVVDAATQAGAVNIGVNFTLSDDTAANRQALQQAVQDATAKATAAASAAHLRIVGIDRIQIGSAFLPGVQADIYNVRASVHSTQLDESDLTFTQTVTVEFLAKP